MCRICRRYGSGTHLAADGTGREWTPFTPANHPAKIKLGHWKRADEAVQQEEDPFEAFGRPGAGPNVMQYSQQEYEQHLTGMCERCHSITYMD
jgi:hypothetical protein